MSEPPVDTPVELLEVEPAQPKQAEPDAVQQAIEADPKVKALFDQIQADKKRLVDRNQALSDQASQLAEAASRNAMEKVEAEVKLGQVGPMVEGLFKGTTQVPKIAARLALRAYKAERDLKNSYHLLEGKTNYWPYIFGLVVLTLFVVFVANPAYAIPAGNWVATPAGSIFAILAVVGVIVVVIRPPWRRG